MYGVFLCVTIRNLPRRKKVDNSNPGKTFANSSGSDVRYSPGIGMVSEKGQVRDDVAFSSGKTGLKPVPDILLGLPVEARDILLVVMDPGADGERDADGRDDGFPLVKGLDLDLHLG